MRKGNFRRHKTPAWMLLIGVLAPVFGAALLATCEVFGLQWNIGIPGSIVAFACAALCYRSTNSCGPANSSNAADPTETQEQDASGAPADVSKRGYAPESAVAVNKLVFWRRNAL